MSGYLGLIDWGIGGLGVLRSLQRRTQALPILYFSDAGFAPYGLLSRAGLTERLRLVVQHLQSEGATGVVVACNAASTVINRLAPRKSLPVWGVIEPALRLVPRGFAGSVGVIGGRRTIRSGIYRRRLVGGGCRVKQRIAQPLSAHVEAGTVDGSACAEALDRILSPLRGTELLLLACTHYPALARQIQGRLPGTQLIDPADALACEVLSSFPVGAALPTRILTTGDPKAMRRAAARAWQFDLTQVEAVPVALGSDQSAMRLTSAAPLK